MLDRPSWRAKLLRGGAWQSLHVAILALFIEASSAIVWALRMVDETCLYTVPWRAVFDIVDRVYIVVVAVTAAGVIVPMALMNRSWRDIVEDGRTTRGPARRATAARALPFIRASAPPA